MFKNKQSRGLLSHVIRKHVHPIVVPVNMSHSLSQNPGEGSYFPLTMPPSLPRELLP